MEQEIFPIYFAKFHAIAVVVVVVVDAIVVVADVIVSLVVVVRSLFGFLYSVANLLPRQ